MTSKYDDLTEATELLLERDLEKHRRNLAESSRLAGELAQIDGLRQAAQSDTGAINARQILGADTLWQGWLATRRAEILRHSAMARAQEADSLARAKTAFSRVEAARKLARQEAEAQQKRRLKAEADANDALGILREARAQGIS
ncbi:hypothetical protein ANTHELSMS3_01057 [Antarctobacter heliothermus]|uniref:Flagellar FliJ protein n=1 Tax=Antarctobacter heliothermus TaxID=74033 RepID=A0A222E0U7_9RHOB|nr:hypothetical protein [Antarctobacter heliothermus]ASP19773.1 hypothetical protein ANTHELSMS3_01057 [Antarctobacter heliothermus]